MTDIFQKPYAALAANSHGPGWLQQLRAESYQKFCELGLPTRKDEDWKYTSLNRLKERQLHLAEGASQKADWWTPWRDPEAINLVFVDGRLSVAQSSGFRELADVSIQPLRDALASGSWADWVRQAVPGNDRLMILNQAFLGEGLAIRVAKNASPSRPIHVYYVTDCEQDEAAQFSRLLVHLEKGACLSLRETFLGGGEHLYFTNPVAQIRLEPGARLEHARLQHEGDRAIHLSSLYVDVLRDANYRQIQVDTGGDIARHNTHARLGAENSSLTLDGVYLVGENQHCDHYSIIDHEIGHTQSSQLYKGVVGANGRAVFNGQVKIRPEAQQSNAFQLNKNLLLSTDAEVDTKPQMEIDADDVSCSHGATVGQLDQDEVFYLCSRGLAPQDATRMLAAGFLREVIQRHPAVAGHRLVQESLQQKLVELYGR
jgi:Fe-S cluster assembly protein SufD